MTDVQPGDRDRDDVRARAMWRAARYADPSEAPEIEDVIAAALAEGRAEGYERCRAEGEALRERVLALAAELLRPVEWPVTHYRDGLRDAAEQFRAAVGADGDGGKGQPAFDREIDPREPRGQYL